MPLPCGRLLSEPSSTATGGGPPSPSPSTLRVGVTCNAKKQSVFFAHLNEAAERHGIHLVPLSLGADDAGQEWRRCARTDGHGGSDTDSIHDDDDDEDGNGVVAATHPSSAAGRLQLDAVIHKRTDDMAMLLRCYGDSPLDAVATKAKRERIAALEAALAPPAVTAIDSLSGVWRVVDRFRLVDAVDAALRRARLPHVGVLPHTDGTALLPPLRSGTAPRWLTAGRPLLLKRRRACGEAACHELLLVADAAAGGRALRGVLSRHKPSDVLVTPFVEDHGGVVFKVYAIGRAVTVQTRASISPSLGRDVGGAGGGSGILSFDIATMLSLKKTRLPHTGAGDDRPAGCSFVQPGGGTEWPGMACADVQAASAVAAAVEPATPPVPGQPPAPPSRQLASALVRAIGGELGMTLLGIDLVCDVRTGFYYVVDINYFPGYTGVVDAHDVLLRHVREVVSDRRDRSSAPSSAPPSPVGVVSFSADGECGELLEHGAVWEEVKAMDLRTGKGGGMGEVGDGERGWMDACDEFSPPAH